MVTVGVIAGVVERRLAAGRLRCPGCSGRLAGWGHARERVVRGQGEIVVAGYPPADFGMTMMAAFQKSLWAERSADWPGRAPRRQPCAPKAPGRNTAPGATGFSQPAGPTACPRVGMAAPVQLRT